MKKTILFGFLAIFLISACTDEKKVASAPASPNPEAEAPVDSANLITSMCQRDFGTAQFQQCVQTETTALEHINTLKQVPQDLVERCAKLPGSRYSHVLSCLQTAMTPPPKSHGYAMEEDGEYGYEGALSQNDQNAGKSVNPIYMYRYLGEKNGTYTVASQSGKVTQSASCKEPCEFIKFQTIYAGQVVKSETVRSTGKAIVDAALWDARNGNLEKYMTPSKQ